MQCLELPAFLCAHSSTPVQLDWPRQFTGKIHCSFLLLLGRRAAERACVQWSGSQLTCCPDCLPSICLHRACARTAPCSTSATTWRCRCDIFVTCAPLAAVAFLCVCVTFCCAPHPQRPGGAGELPQLLPAQPAVDWPATWPRLAGCRCAQPSSARPPHACAVLSSLHSLERSSRCTRRTLVPPRSTVMWQLFHVFRCLLSFAAGVRGARSRRSGVWRRGRVQPVPEPAARAVQRWVEDGASLLLAVLGQV